MPATFAAIFAALYAAHQVADHWTQTDHQASTKGAPGWPGRFACAAHVTTYTITAALALLALALVTDLRPSLLHVALGLTISAVSHYVVDRRTPLRKIAKFLPSTRTMIDIGSCRPGHDDKPCLGTGSSVLDQSWNIGWLYVAALVASAGVA